MKPHHPYTKIITYLLIAAFVFQDVLWAHPELFAEDPSLLQVPSVIDPVDVSFLAKFTAEYFARRTDIKKFKYPLVVPLPKGRGVAIYNFSRWTGTGPVPCLVRDARFAPIFEFDTYFDPDGSARILNLHRPGASGTYERIDAVSRKQMPLTGTDTEEGKNETTAPADGGIGIHTLGNEHVQGVHAGPSAAGRAAPGRRPTTIGKKAFLAVLLASILIPSTAFGGTIDLPALRDVVSVVESILYDIALAGGVALSAVTAWFIYKCFTAELSDDVRKLLKTKEEVAETTAKPSLFEPGMIVRKKHEEAIFSKIAMDDVIESRIRSYLGQSWFRRTYIDRRRLLILNYFDNKTGKARAGALLEIFERHRTIYAVCTRDRQSELHRIDEETIRSEIAIRNPHRVVFVFDEAAVSGGDLYEKFGRLFPDVSELFPGHKRSDDGPEAYSRVMNANAGVSGFVKPAFIVYEKMHLSVEKRVQVYAEGHRASYIYHELEKFWWIQTFLKQLMIGAFLGVIIKHAESLGVLDTYSFVQYLAQIAIPLIFTPLVAKKIMTIVLHRWDRRQEDKPSSPWDAMVRAIGAEGRIRNAFFTIGIFSAISRVLFFMLIPQSAFPGAFAMPVLLTLTSSQYLSALVGWVIIEAVLDIIVGEYSNEAQAGRLQYNEKAVKRRIAGFFPTIDGVSNMLTYLAAGSGLLLGIGVIGIGLTAAVVPMLAGASAILIISAFRLTNKMREYDHYLEIDTDFWLPMKEENRIWLSDTMALEFNPNDVRIWTAARLLTRRNGTSWLPWLEDFEVKLMYKEKPDIDLPKYREGELVGRSRRLVYGYYIKSKDKADPGVWLRRIHGKSDRYDAWRNIVEREVAGAHQVIICPNWEDRLIYHVSEPGGFLAGYLRTKFGRDVSDTRLQDAEHILLKVPKRQWDSYEAALKKAGFRDAEDLLLSLQRGEDERTTPAFEALGRFFDSLEQVWLAYFAMEPDGILDVYLRGVSGARAPPDKIRELAFQIARFPDKKWKPLLDELSGLGFKRLGDLVEALSRGDAARREDALKALRRFIEETFTERPRQDVNPAASAEGQTDAKRTAPGSPLGVFTTLLKEDRYFTEEELIAAQGCTYETLRHDFTALVGHLRLATRRQGEGPRGYKLIPEARENSFRIIAVLRALQERYGARPSLEALKNIRRDIDDILGRAPESSTILVVPDTATIQKVQSEISRAEREGRSLCYTDLDHNIKRRLSEFKGLDDIFGGEKRIRFITSNDKEQFPYHPFMWKDSQMPGGRFGIFHTYEGKAYVRLDLLLFLIDYFEGAHPDAMDFAHPARLLVGACSSALNTERSPEPSAGAYARDRHSSLARLALILWTKYKEGAWNISPDDRVSAVQQMTDLCAKGLVHRTDELAGRIDGHIHSIYSDGEFTPSEIIDEYRMKGASGVALTDHNTFAGIEEAVRAARRAKEIAIIPGAEITAYWGEDKAHYLIYYAGTDKEFLKWLQDPVSKKDRDRIETIGAKQREKMRLKRVAFNRVQLRIWEKISPAIRGPDPLHLSDKDEARYFHFGAVQTTGLARMLVRKYGLAALGVKDIEAAKKRYFDGIVQTHEYKDLIKGFDPAGEHLELEELIRICRRNNFYLGPAHPILRDDHDTGRLRKLLSTFADFEGSPAFQFVEVWHGGMASARKMEEVEVLVDEFNAPGGLYHAYPLRKTGGSDTHSDWDNDNGVKCPPVSIAPKRGARAMKCSVELARLLPVEVKRRYFADLLMAGLGIGQGDLFSHVPYLVWSEDDALLGERNARGEQVTITPSVIGVLGNFAGDNDRREIAADILQHMLKSGESKPSSRAKAQEALDRIRSRRGAESRAPSPDETPAKSEAPGPIEDGRDFWPYLHRMLDEKCVADDLFAATVSTCLRKKAVFAFELGVGGANSAKALAVMEALESLKKDPRYRELLKDLTIVSSVTDNLASKLRPYIDEGAVVFTFARLSERAKLAPLESRVEAAYVDIPDDFPIDAYVPLPEVVAMALGRYLGICDPKKVPEGLRREINVGAITIDGRVVIFALLPKSLRVDTEKESVARYLLLKKFLAAV